jgi:hypothetical protein
MTKPEPPSRLGLHAVLTVGGALALMLGEYAGNRLFRDGSVGLSDLGDEAVLGALLGNAIAVWIWSAWKRKSGG